MNDETVTEQATEETVAPAETEQAKVDATRAEIAAQGTEAEVEEDAIVAAEVEPPTTETETEDPAQEDDAGEEEPVRKKKATGYSRLKARHQAAIAENDALRRQIEEAKSKEEEKPAPTLDEFDDDYDAWQRALTAHDTAKVVREELSKTQQAEAERREKEAAALAEEEFMERLDAAREEIPDYDATLQALQGHVGQLNPSLVNLLQESDQGDAILYHLGKNLTTASRINGMGVIACAKEIGSLEAKLSVPKQKKTTQAPPPVTPVKGGGTPPPSDLTKIAATGDMNEYIRARQEQMSK